MEKILYIHIEKLTEGCYLATSDTIQGLVAQGRTLTETIEIAQDVTKKLIEAHEIKNYEGFISLVESFDYPMVIGV